MCGIAGIFAYHYAAALVDRNELRVIRDAMHKRGPDGAGEWYSPDARVGLAHRRLSIIDLSEKGKQPMCTTDKAQVITFNGEIYNYRALRLSLEQQGYHFYSNSDTEVLLHLYRHKGVDMLKDLRGMFAFALWDQTKQALLLARDPYGIKPLYYADDGWTLYFASQVKALLTSAKISKEKSAAGQVGFYLWGSIPEPFTLYEAIQMLPAGHYTWVNPLGTHSPIQYFSMGQTFLHPASPIKKAAEAEAYIKEALRDSVQHHLVADVPVGAFLSSGIDSGALVGLMSEYSQQRIETLTLTFQEFIGQAQDEAPLAKQVADYYQVNNYQHRASESQFKEDLPTILQDMDQPSIDGMNTWLVSKATKALGLKVAISGLGGDELLGGYPSFKNLPRLQNLFGAFHHIPFVPDIWQSFFNFFIAPHTKINPKVAGLFRYSHRISQSYFLQRGLFMPWELSQLLDKDIVSIGLEKLNLSALLEQPLRPDPKKNFARIAALESSLYMRNQLLRDSDWASMAHALEIRVPLVDAWLLQKLAPLMLTFALNNKQLLANAPTKPLPHFISQRQKTGFTIPIRAWLMNHKDFDHWQAIPLLRRKNCHWSRQLAYTLMTIT